MKILFPSSEIIPFAKTGGLADVAGALPVELEKLGHEVHLVMPLYQATRNVGIPFHSTKIRLRVPVGREVLISDVFDTELPGGPTVHLLQYDPYFNRAEFYRTAEGDYPDNDRRFIFFCRAVMELGKALNISWDILHGHDWHTGLIAAYLSTLYRNEKVFAHARSLLTIHNLAYQGVFPRETMALTGLPEGMFNPDGLEFWGRFNFLKAGLVYSDRINTVSPTYAQEIQSPETGCGLDGVLRGRQGVISGILNGIDNSIWNPWTDPMIPIHFKPDRLQRKNELKHFRLEDQRLVPLPDAPLLAIVSRLDDQKGFDILAEISERLMEVNVLLILLGTGAKKYHDFFLRLKAQHPRRLSVNLKFDNELAHRIYAGADMFLMPSRYEPCGLGQLISMRYGTVPVVRQTGGLADTVVDFDGQKGNGFTFKNYSGEALLMTIKRACEVYQHREAWFQVARNGMDCDFSWNRSVRDYEELYSRMLSGE